MIELLVVILIIGILAAIAIPSFLNQKGKANDASAKELARTAQTTAETIATENGGSYEKVTPAELNTVEKTIPIAEANGNPYISVTTHSATGYSVTATSPSTADTFTITNTAGVITRACTGVGSKGGCNASKTW